jgi:HlyD family secretion protein
MKTSYKIILAIVLVLILLIVLKKTNVIGKKDLGKEIETALVQETTIVETVSATGKIQPEIEIKISSEVSGEIIALPIKEGQTVKKGQLLVKINPEIYVSNLNRTNAGFSNSKAGLAQADASFKEANANYARSKTLFEKGIISKADWDKAIASFENAKALKDAAYYSVQSAGASVNEAKESLGRTIIYAPVDGTISKLDAELGERVVGTQQMAGTEILRVADLTNMEVEVDVNENDIVKISIGNEAIVEVDAYLNKQFKGEVTSISNSANNLTATDQVTNFKVKVRILKESYQDMLTGKPTNYSPFRPGMTATVDIITKKSEKTIAIPISSVVIKSDTTPVKITDVIEEDDKNSASKKVQRKLECVFVKNGNKAKIKIIKTGIQDNNNIQILEGLKKGETIIVGPYGIVNKDLNSGDLITEIKK